MDWNQVPSAGRTPDFNQLLAVLAREVPSRPTLFEFFLNEKLYLRILTELSQLPQSHQEIIEAGALAMCRLGYDFCTMQVPGFSFAAGLVVRRREKSHSLNEGSIIHNRDDFERFPWPDPDEADYDILERLQETIPKGMKLIPFTPNGLLENVIDLVGFENLCMMLYDDPQLVKDIFDAVGSRLLAFYKNVVPYEIVGAAICNDDWGFKTQTMISTRDMRKYIFPWHKQFVEAIHDAGKPAILHSCGRFDLIFDDIVDLMKFDARHSYEDNILPVEQAYDAYHDRIAILGGIDVDFVCRSTPEEVYQRSKAMLERAAKDGAYALGTGNSVPAYVPDQNYFAMVQAALDLN